PGAGRAVRDALHRVRGGVHGADPDHAFGLAAAPGNAKALPGVGRGAGAFGRRPPDGGLGAGLGVVSAAHNPRKIHGALEVVGLDPDTRVTASELNVVDRARLEIARALATKPVRSEEHTSELQSREN